MRHRAVLVLAACVLSAQGSMASAPRGSVRHISPQVVYGQDDRIEYFGASPAWQHVADAVCVLVERDELIFNGDGTVTLRTIPYATSFYPPLCDDEPFRSEPTLGECTAFLAAPDRVVTTGHCIEPDDLDDVAFVFGFALTDPNQPAPLVVPESNVYFPAAVIGRSLHDAPDYSDYTVVKLDRPVAGRDPLAIRTTGTPDVGTPVVLIGYPFGLPLKLAGGANVKRVTSRFFEANTDSYVGNSGSPVVNANTLTVEGMLYFGKSDYALDTVIVSTPAADTTTCIRSRVLPDDYGSYEGSIMTRDFSRFVADSTSSPEVSLLATGVGFDHVDLEWGIASSWLPGAELDRRSDVSDWNQLADVVADDAGRFAYQDHAVISGRSYGYRLTWADANAVQHSAETWVEVPLDLEFALAGARPNPAHAHDLNVSLSLPVTAPGRLSLYDISGRRVADVDISGLSPGAHLVKLDPERTARSGVYWLRLSQGARSASRIVVLLD